jgi:hypothetical protein
MADDAREYTPPGMGFRELQTGEKGPATITFLGRPKPLGIVTDQPLRTAKGPNFVPPQVSMGGSKTKKVGDAIEA